MKLDWIHSSRQQLQQARLNFHFQTSCEVSLNCYMHICMYTCVCVHQNLFVKDELMRRYLQISVGMATKSNSSQSFKIFSTMLVSAERKCTGRLSVSFETGCTLTPFVSGKSCARTVCNSVAHLCVCFWSHSPPPL